MPQPAERLSSSIGMSLAGQTKQENYDQPSRLLRKVSSTIVSKCSEEIRPPKGTAGHQARRRWERL